MDFSPICYYLLAAGYRYLAQARSIWDLAKVRVLMDTVTQAVFGAVIGHVGFHSKLGWRALAAGVALAPVPDLAVFGSLSDPLNEWRHHRGVTHSIFFGPVIGPLFGYAIWRSYQWRS